MENLFTEVCTAVGESALFFWSLNLENVIWEMLAPPFPLPLWKILSCPSGRGGRRAGEKPGGGRTQVQTLRPACFVVSSLLPCLPGFLQSFSNQPPGPLCFPPPPRNRNHGRQRDTLRYWSLAALSVDRWAAGGTL